MNVRLEERFQVSHLGPCSMFTNSNIFSMYTGSICFVYTFFLIVPEPTRIVQAPELVSTTRGSSARFNCRISSDSSLNIQVSWLKNDQPLSYGWR